MGNFLIIQLPKFEKYLSVVQCQLNIKQLHEWDNSISLVAFSQTDHSLFLCEITVWKEMDYSNYTANGNMVLTGI